MSGPSFWFFQNFNEFNLLLLSYVIYGGCYQIRVLSGQSNCLRWQAFEFAGAPVSPSFEEKRELKEIVSEHRGNN